MSFQVISGFCHSKNKICFFGISRSLESENITDLVIVYYDASVLDEDGIYYFPTVRKKCLSLRPPSAEM
jgi:hypothetical protein